MRSIRAGAAFTLVSYSVVALAQPAPEPPAPKDSPALTEPAAPASTDAPASPASKETPDLVAPASKASLPSPAAAAQGFPEAQPAPERRIPDVRFVIGNLLVFRWNPLGLEDQIRAGFQFRLMRSYEALARDNFIFFGIAPKINPAFVKVGPSLEVQPLSILNLRVAVEFMDYFSTFGYLQSFASPLENYSDTTLEEGKSNKKNYATSGIHFIFEPTLQLKAGPIALRNKFSVEYWSMTVHPGDTLFYEATLDTLVPANGWVLTNDLDLLYITRFRLVVGARYSVVRPIYSQTDYRAGDDAESNPNGHQRLGLLLAYTFFDRGFTRFNKPTLLLISSWYLQHRWRTGADVSQAMPYIVLGFAFQSDLL